MACPRETLLSALEGLAPTYLAEPWDNVGLLIDPQERVEFERALLTVDLNDGVLDEALEAGCDFIVAYHPPIFSGLKRLRLDRVEERVVLRAVRQGLTIYSPHTALDAVAGGMTDWLGGAFGPGSMSPIVPSDREARSGAGRLVRLDRAISVERAVEMVKTHLGLSHLRLSRAEREDKIETVAVCPGAGGSVFEKVGAVDLLLTGEMRHHDILARRARGTHVIVTDHTNTERGYLPHLGKNIQRACPGLHIHISAVDADPLQVL